jgi:hypothetical protein
MNLYKLSNGIILRKYNWSPDGKSYLNFVCAKDNCTWCFSSIDPDGERRFYCKKYNSHLWFKIKEQCVKDNLTELTLLEL